MLKRRYLKVISFKIKALSFLNITSLKNKSLFVSSHGETHHGIRFLEFFNQSKTFSDGKNFLIFPLQSLNQKLV